MFFNIYTNAKYHKKIKLIDRTTCNFLEFDYNGCENDYYLDLIIFPEFNEGLKKVKRQDKEKLILFMLKQIDKLNEEKKIPIDKNCLEILFEFSIMYECDTNFLMINYNEIEMGMKFLKLLALS